MFLATVYASLMSNIETKYFAVTYKMVAIGKILTPRVRRVVVFAEIVMKTEPRLLKFSSMVFITTCEIPPTPRGPLVPGLLYWMCSRPIGLTYQSHLSWQKATLYFNGVSTSTPQAAIPVVKNSSPMGEVFGSTGGY